MSQFRVTDGVKPTFIAIVVIVLALLVSITTFSSVAAPQDAQKDRLTTDLDGEEVELAELRLSILSQQIVVASAEMELLEPTQLAADQKVAAADANLATATIEAENCAKLYEKNVISEAEVRLSQSNRNAVAAGLKIAQAQSILAGKSGKVQQANIKLLQLREKMASIELRNMKRRVGNVQ